ncbi:SH3 domain-containing protein [Catenovulum sediminis]|uniref:SH3 domain-containing protein n=1 Tax=Catenovulum sediminis TaxID=1740262 RepID=A0ABV1RL64_9ALTE|nr:SH3 domain-containing protein [Catenovulum sediminis]
MRTQFSSNYLSPLLSFISIVCVVSSVIICLTSFKASASESTRESGSERENEKNESIQLIVEVPFVEMHSGPNIAYPVIYVAERGEVLTVVRKRTSWLKVSDKRGNQGWIHQDALRLLTQKERRIQLAEYSFEDYQNRNWETGVMFGQLNKAEYFNWYIAYMFDPVLSTEFSAGKVLGQSSDSTVYDLILLAQPFPQWTVTPFLGVGAGVIETKPHSVLAQAQDRNNTLLTTNVGLKYHVTRNFIIRAEYKFSLVLTKRNSNEELDTWKLGISAFF